MMFSGKRVRQARELRRLTQQELADRLGKSQATITHVERGFKEPSADLIAAVAQETRFPMSFFSSDPPVEFPVEVLLFRARASMTRRDALAAARYAEIVFEMRNTLSSYATKIPLSLERSNKPPADAARDARRWLELPADEPVRHLVSAVERAGIVVIGIPLEQDDIDAFSAWIDGLPVIALCPGRPSGDRKRWNTGHELGHLVMHFDRKIRSDQHKEADEFAAELLMPERAMRREMAGPVTIAGLAALKPRWGVSIQALIYRAHEVGIISDRQYRYLFEQVSIRGWRKREPANLDIPVEKPRALRKFAELSPYGDDYSRLASELRLSVENVSEILDTYDDLSAVTQHGRTLHSSKVIPLRKR